MKTKSLHQDVYISIAVYILVGIFLVMSTRLVEASAVFPRMILIGLGLLNTVIMFKGIKHTKAMRISGTETKNSIRWEVIKAPMIVFLMTAGYAALFAFTNFFISTSVFIIAIMKFYKVKSWKSILLMVAIFNAAIYLGFVMGLRVPLL